MKTTFKRLSYLLLFIGFALCSQMSSAQISGWYNVTTGTYNNTAVTGGDTVLFFGAQPWCHKVWNVTGGTILAPSYCAGLSSCITLSGAAYLGVVWDCTTPSKSLSVTSLNTFWWGIFCSNSTVTYNFTTITPSLTLSSISGASAVCLGEQVNYAVPSITDAQSYFWTVTGGVVLSGNGSNNVTVQWNSAGSQTLTVRAKRGPCSGPIQSLPVTVTGNPVISFSSLPNPICGNTASISLSVTPTTLLGYNWTFPVGVSSGSPVGTSINFDVDKYAASGDITVTAYKTCSSGPVAVVGVKPIVVDPWPTPAELIDGPKVVCKGSTGIYSIPPSANADTYIWTVASGAVMTYVSPTSRQVTWNTVGSKWIAVQPYSNINGCNQGPVTTQPVTVIEDYAATPVSSVQLNHTNLTALGTHNLIIDHCGDLVTCINKEIERAELNVLLNTGEYYEYGNNVFSSTVNVEVKGYDNVVGGSIIATYNPIMTIDQDQPEQLFNVDVTADYYNVHRWEIHIASYTPGTIINNAISLQAYRTEEFKYDVRSVSPLVNLQSVVQANNQVTFNWTSSCIDFPNYELQVLRLFNTNPLYITPTTILAKAIDWGEALTIETQSNDQNITLTLAEGTGYYVWRVRPMGDYFEGGVSNSANWGEWSNHSGHLQGNTPTIGGVSLPLRFFYNQFDETKNWIYGRVFTEGDLEENMQVRVSENMTFANGLQQIKQNQIVLSSQNVVMATQTVNDYSGRPSLVSMSTPINNQSTLGYKGNFMLDPSGNLYTANDFDLDINHNNPTQVKDAVPADNFYYYSDNNPEINIPTAEGYPFNRTLYYPDASGHVRETGGIGNTHRIRPNPNDDISKTVKTYYSGVADGELIRIFGDEAPSSESVIKVITTGPNKVTSATYLSKDGKTLASFLIRTGKNDFIEPDPVMLPLASQLTSGFSVDDTLTNSAPYGPYGSITTKTQTFVNIPTTTVQLNYQLDPGTIEDLCVNFCTSCDYYIEFLVKDVNHPDSNLYYYDTLLKPESCSSLVQFTHNAAVTVNVGTYSFTKRIRSFNEDPLITAVNTTYLEEHLDSLENLYNTTISAQLSAVYAFLDGPNIDLNGLYNYLGIDTSVANPDEVYEDSLVYIHIGCDSVGIPILLCPVNECDPSAMDFESYFMDNWAGEAFAATDGGGNYIFTHSDPAYRYGPGELNDLISNMMNDPLTPYNCDSLWNCWRSITLSYQLLENMGTSDPNYDFNMVEEFLTCTGLRIRGISSVDHNTNFTNGGYLSHAYAFFDYALGNNLTCENLICHPSNPSGPGCTVAAMNTWTTTDWQNFYNCVNHYSPGSAPDPNVFATATADSCREACESKRTAFRNGIIRLYHNDSLYVENDQYYLTYDTTWGQVYVPNTNNPLPGGFTFDLSQTELDCMVDSLVNWCKEGCELTVFTHVSGTQTILDSVGTMAQLQSLTERMTWAWEFDFPDPNTGNCDNGFVPFSGTGGGSSSGIVKLWDKRYGGGKDDQLYDFKPTSDGGYIAVGWSNSSMGYDKSNSQIGLKDYWVVKLDGSGNKIWDVTIGGEKDDELKSVLEVDDGYLLGGSSASPASAMKSAPNFGGHDYWLVKIDFSGTVMWDRTYGGQRDDKMYMIQPMGNGDFMLGGYSESAQSGNKSDVNYGYRDYWVVRIDNAGNPMWDRSYGGREEDVLTSLRRISGNEWVLSGYSNSRTIDYPQNNGAIGGYDYWAIRIDDSNGNAIWDKMIGGSGDDYATENEITVDGHVIMMGVTNSMANPGGGKTAGLYGKTDYWVVKLKNDGTTVLWDQVYGGFGDEFDGVDPVYNLGIDRTPDGGYLLGGSSNSPISGLKSESGYGGFDYWQVKIDANGTFEWDKTFGAEGYNYHKVVHQLSDGSYIAAGFSNGAQMGDKSEAPRAGSYDYWIIKFKKNQNNCPFPDFCFRFIPFPQIDSADVHFLIPYTCEQVMATDLKDLLEQATYDYIQQQLANFEQQYNTNCKNIDNVNDKFWLSYPLAYHHYTLYYYNRSGSLIRTVPPKGVNFVTNLSHRNTATNHDFVTVYKYNSMKQLVEQNSPDKGGVQFYYDGVGRLRFSQNEEQVIKGTFSYTKYDELSRVVEAGESNESIGTFYSYSNTNNSNFPFMGSERVYTKYSLPIVSGGGYINGDPARFLQNRVSYMYNDAGALTEFSYDPHGNVEWTRRFMDGFGSNYIRYEYDLVTGNTKRVAYNEGLLDEYFHRYFYDEDSRITKVFTSIDGKLWDRDASYQYYDFGRVKREEIGEDQLQGNDYVYTLYGWLKGKNHASLDNTKDPGSDNFAGNRFAMDAFGMQLNYYTGDFNRSLSPFNSAEPTVLLPGTNRDLFNGNISTWAFNSMGTGSGLQYEQLTGQGYQYDELNRLRTANFQYYNTSWNLTTDYNSSYSYDANGNVLSLVRNGYASHNIDMDNLSYHYYPNTNQLEYVDDVVNAINYSADIDDQAAVNYTYDAVGQLTKDVSEGIDTIEWAVHGKIKNIVKSTGEHISFVYDASGDRILKIDKPNPADSSTYKYWFYVRDASGSIMAVYCKMDSTIMSSSGEALVLNDLPIYGSKRVGQYQNQLLVKHGNDITNQPISTKPSSTIYTRVLGRKVYETADHLNNVRVVYSDKKLSQLNGSNDPIVSSFTVDLVSINNYFAYGSDVPGRNYTTGEYRFGFQGQEMDAEIKGDGNSYEFNYRFYDPRIARFLSVDPLAPSYPWYTPYQFAGNTPIMAIDLEGLEPESVVDKEGKLTASAIKILNALTGVDESLLQQVQIMHTADNKFNAPWYNPNKGGGAMTVGDNIYFTENWFAKSGYGSKKFGNTSYGGNDGFSAFMWLSLLSHEVGHLPQTDAFGKDKKGIRMYLGYFAGGYILRTISLQFPVHDGFAPEITAELGQYVFNRIFVSVDANGDQYVNQLGHDFVDALASGDLDKMNEMLEKMNEQISQFTEEYKKEHPKKFKRMEKKLNKMQKKQDKRVEKQEKKNSE
jgi:RHS repeat-associated protein